MLTNGDLKLIRKTVREEVEAEVDNAKKSLKNDIVMSRIKIQNNIGELSDRIKNLEIGQKSLDKKLDQIQEDISEILTAVDKRQTSLEKRTDNIEDHLNLPHPQ